MDGWWGRRSWTGISCCIQELIMIYINLNVPSSILWRAHVANEQAMDICGNVCWHLVDRWRIASLCNSWLWRRWEITGPSSIHPSSYLHWTQWYHGVGWLISGAHRANVLNTWKTSMKIVSKSGLQHAAVFGGRNHFCLLSNSTQMLLTALLLKSLLPSQEMAKGNSWR